jgi:transcriptional regulator GlxA family with amidase domain
MKRRTFLASSLALGFGIDSLARAPAQEAAQAKAIANGGSLKPPAEGTIAVAIAISAMTTWIDFVGPLAVFETWQRDPKSGRPVPRFKTFLVSETTQPQDGLVPDFTFADAPPAAIVLVPAQKGSPALLDWLKRVSTTTDVTMSVCTGAKHLALAGLLDGLPATSHHGAIDAFRKEFPKVQWQAGLRFVETPRIATGGGLTAGIDLGLRVVERYFGRAEALVVAEHLEYEGRGWIVG